MLSTLGVVAGVAQFVSGRWNAAVPSTGLQARVIALAFSGAMLFFVIFSVAKITRNRSR
jgi:uncharacterized membrane protein YeaQ/YmgE (transglycosylase-associated protein family)